MTRRGLAAVGAVLLAAAVLAGCGSGDDATTEDTVAGQTAPTGSAETRSQAQTGNGARASEGENRDQAGNRREGGDKQDRPGGSNQAKKSPGHDSQGEGAEPTRQQRVKRKLEKECPAGVDKASCKALVEDYVANPEPPPGTTVTAPEDCVQAMSQEECEATLRAQKATEGTYGVDVEECLAHPTPRCEEVLRPIFEQQQAAGQAGG